jgi:hypothetical protein
VDNVGVFNWLLFVRLCKIIFYIALGKDWAALLVAGNDTTDPKIAEAFKFDVENMEKVVKSKTPLIMGIR